MPIYEYECHSCHTRFEYLLRPSSTEPPAVPTCPECQSADLERLRSGFAVSSEGTRQANLQQARKLNKPVLREKQQAELEYIKHAHDDH